MIPLPIRSHTAYLPSGHKITIEQEAKRRMWCVQIMEMRSKTSGSKKHMLQAWAMEGCDDSGELAITRVIEAAFGIVTDHKQMSESSLSWDDDGHLCWRHGHAILYFSAYPTSDILVMTYDYDAMAAIRDEINTPIRD